MRRLVLVLVGLERWLAAVLVGLGGPVRVHPFPGSAADGRVRLDGRVLVGAPQRTRGAQARHPAAATRSGSWAVLRANLLPFVTVEVPRAQVRVSVGGRETVVEADGDGYVHARLDGLALPPGPCPATLTPVRPPGRPAAGTVHVVDPAADVVVVSDIDDTVVDSGVAHGVLATLRTVLLSEQGTRVPLRGAPELYRALARGESAERPFFYLSTSPWNLAGFLQDFLLRHGFPQGPLLLTDWGPGTSSLLRVSSREHKLSALRDLAEQLPRARFVLLGDTGQQDPEIYAAFADEQPGRVAAVYVRRAGSPGAATDARAGQATALLASCAVPHLVTDDSAQMLRHARGLGLVAPDGA